MSNVVGLSSRFVDSCAKPKRSCKAVHGIEGKARLCLLTGKHVSDTKKCKAPKRCCKKCCKQA